MSKSSSRKFKPGDVVKCLSNNVSYPAKILQCDEGKKLPYLVHYLQWKSRYDEWVTSERITSAELSPIALKRVGKKLLRQSPLTSTPIKPVVKKIPENKSDLVQGEKTQVKIAKKNAIVATKGRSSPIPLKKMTELKPNLPLPKLKRVVDDDFVYYKSDSRNFLTLDEIRQYCANRGLHFDEMAYNFLPPTLQPALPTIKKTKMNEDDQENNIKHAKTNSSVRRGRSSIIVNNEQKSKQKAKNETKLQRQYAKSVPQISELVKMRRRKISVNKNELKSAQNPNKTIKKLARMSFESFGRNLSRKSLAKVQKTKMEKIEVAPLETAEATFMRDVAVLSNAPIPDGKRSFRTRKPSNKFSPESVARRLITKIKEATVDLNAKKTPKRKNMTTVKPAKKQRMEKQTKLSKEKKKSEKKKKDSAKKKRKSHEKSNDDDALPPPECVEVQAGIGDQRRGVDEGSPDLPSLLGSPSSDQQKLPGSKKISLPPTHRIKSLSESSNIEKLPFVSMDSSSALSRTSYTNISASRLHHSNTSFSPPPVIPSRMFTNAAAASHFGSSLGSGAASGAKNIPGFLNQQHHYAKSNVAPRGQWSVATPGGKESVSPANFQFVVQRAQRSKFHHVFPLIDAARHEGSKDLSSFARRDFSASSVSADSSRFLGAADPISKSGIFASQKFKHGGAHVTTIATNHSGSSAAANRRSPYFGFASPPHRYDSESDTDMNVAPTDSRPRQFRNSSGSGGEFRLSSPLPQLPPPPPTFYAALPPEVAGDHSYGRMQQQVPARSATAAGSGAATRSFSPPTTQVVATAVNGGGAFAQQRQRTVSSTSSSSGAGFGALPKSISLSPNHPIMGNGLMSPPPQGTPASPHAIAGFIRSASSSNATNCAGTGGAASSKMPANFLEEDIGDANLSATASPLTDTTPHPIATTSSDLQTVTSVVID